MVFEAAGTIPEGSTGSSASRQLANTNEPYHYSNNCTRHAFWPKKHIWYIAKYVQRGVDTAQLSWDTVQLDLPILKRSHMNHILRFTCIIATLILLAGCTRNRVGLHDVTPEMSTLSQTYTDVDVDLAMVDNQNNRMFEEDLGRVWYTNRPSRLSPLPVVNTTGNSP